MALLLLTACGGATVINTDIDAVDFTIDGSEHTVIVSADGSWNVKECPEWATTNIQDSTLVIKTARNETGALREGDIMLAGNDDVQATIKVTQASKCTRISPESNNVKFEKEGGTQTVKIDTDGAPNVEAPEGFTATYAGGVLTINAPTNEGGAKNGKIKLTGDDQSATIAVSQKGNVCPKCNGTGKIKCSKCGGRGITGGGVEWYGCSACGGRGYAHRYTEPDGFSGRLVSSVDKYNYRKGSGKKKCPQCGGSGQ